MPRRARTLPSLVAPLLAFALTALTAPLPAQSVGLSLLDSARVQVAPGAKLAVPLRVDLSAAGTTTLAALQGALTWSASRLTFDSLRVVSSTGFSLTANTTGAASGSVSFNAFGTTALAASGPLAMAYFTAGSGTGGTLLTLAPTIAGNEAGTDVLSLIRVRNLGVCVAPTGAWGDANDDGAVNVIDAQQVARYSVALSVANSAAMVARGDVTADGAVNVIDAQQIARYSVALSAAARVNTALYTPPVVASVSLTPSGTQSLSVAATVALTAEPRDAASTSLAGCQPVTWTSSNPTVASVSNVGLVTAVAAGSATITATSGGTSTTAAIVVAGDSPIYFWRFGSEDGAEEVFSIKPDGTGLTRITTSAGMDRWPAPSPDRSRLAISSGRWCTPGCTGSPELYIGQPNGSGMTQITSGLNTVYGKAWSPNGNVIVVESQLGTTSSRDRRLYSVVVATGSRVRITDEESQLPDWSPDGTRILYCSLAGVTAINPDGAGRQVIRNGMPSRGADPTCGRASWSPDGRSIAFDQGAGEIWVMNADGSNPRLLLNGASGTGQPVWSPDGTRIAFHSPVSGLYQIFRMRADGTDLRQVTSLTGTGGASSAAWK